jgi:hypothetical protein
MKANCYFILSFHCRISQDYCSEVCNKIQEGFLLASVYFINLRKDTNLYITTKMSKENEEWNFEYKIFSTLERFHINPYLIMLKMTLFMMYGGKSDDLFRIYDIKYKFQNWFVSFLYKCLKRTIFDHLYVNTINAGGSTVLWFLSGMKSHLTYFLDSFRIQK